MNNTNAFSKRRNLAGLILWGIGIIIVIGICISPVEQGIRLTSFVLRADKIISEKQTALIYEINHEAGGVFSASLTKQPAVKRGRLLL